MKCQSIQKYYFFQDFCSILFSPSLVHWAHGSCYPGFLNRRHLSLLHPAYRKCERYKHACSGSNSVACLCFDRSYYPIQHGFEFLFIPRYLRSASSHDSHLQNPLLYKFSCSLTTTTYANLKFCGSDHRAIGWNAPAFGHSLIFPHSLEQRYWAACWTSVLDSCSKSTDYH